jgi:hypothetical protein
VQEIADQFALRFAIERYVLESLAGRLTAEQVRCVRDQVQAQAMHRLKNAGLSSDGFQAMLSELGGAGVTALGQLNDDVLGRLARKGASAETIARWNAANAEPDPEPEPDPSDVMDPDDMPAAWAVPA